MITTTQPTATRTVNDALVEELRALGTEAVFGLMGEDTADLIARLVDPGGIRFYGFRHENPALMAAYGYAWATGDLGVCVLSRGPGATNAATAAVTATRAGARVLVITGDGPLESVARPDIKEFDHAAFAASVGLAHFTTGSPEQALPALAAAVASARAGTPSLLTVPTDLFRAPCGPAPAPRLTARERPAPVPADADIDAAAALLSAARRPLILAGRGALGAAAELEALAERSGALLGTSLLAKDLFRDSPYNLGIVGGFASDAARRLFDDIDGVLVFGASLTSFTTAFHRLFQGIPVAQVDVDPAAIDANFPVTFGMSGDARETAARILAALPTNGREHELHGADVLRSLREPWDDLGDGDGTTSEEIDPRTLALELGTLLPRGTTIVVDGGHHLAFTGAYTRVDGPDRFRLTTEFASVGLGLGAALGAAVGRADAPAVLQIGDGGLMMTLGDLETIVRCGVPLIIVVMNDRAYGAERHFMDLMGTPHELSKFPEVDFEGLGRTLGIESVTIRSLDALRRLAPAFAERTAPLLLDCRIAPHIRANWFDDL